MVETLARPRLIKIMTLTCQIVGLGRAMSGSVLSKTAIFPKNEGRKREISNESAQGSSIRKANV